MTDKDLENLEYRIADLEKGAKWWTLASAPVFVGFLYAVYKQFFG
jgi:hypothetical protein